MKKFLCCLFLFLFSLYGIFAQDSKEPILKHYIGGGGGMSLGYGLTYRYWPGVYGGQVSFAPYWYEDSILINIGGAGLMSLHETKNTRLFLYAGGSYTYSSSDYDVYESEHVVSAGIGPGIEIYFFENFVFNVMFGYGFNSDSGLSFTGEAYLFYRF